MRNFPTPAEMAAEQMREWTRKGGTMEKATPWAIAYAIMLYNYNVRFEDQMTAALGHDFGQCAPSYREEWQRRFVEGFGALFGHLDHNGQRRYADAAWSRYGREAIEREEKCR